MHEVLVQKEEALPKFWRWELNLRTKHAFSFRGSICFAYNMTNGYRVLTGNCKLRDPSERDFPTANQQVRANDLCSL